MINFTVGRKLEELVRSRRKAQALEDRGVRTLVTQLLRFGVCPCIALGRFSTCCRRYER
jgi:hypothetical protein